MKVIKIIMALSLLIISALFIWTAILSIQINNLKLKQFENDKKFEVMGNALFLEITADEWKKRGNYNALENIK